MAMDNPAKSAGLCSGDVIVQYGDTRIDRARTLARSVLNTKPGTEVDITYLRDGEQHICTVTIIERD